VSYTPPIKGQVKTKNKVSCTTTVGEGQTKNSVLCTPPVFELIEKQTKDSVSCTLVVIHGHPPKESKTKVDNTKDDVISKTIVKCDGR